MSFSNINEIGIKCDEIDALGGISHIFTTKNGGCSEGALSSLNMGINRPDSRENIIIVIKPFVLLLAQIIQKPYFRTRHTRQT
ncbi:MAG: hypothetical protein IKB89_05155 [Clostridia bacterium]|nr:hypothetical protein [Clostridia bacterium]